MKGIKGPRATVYAEKAVQNWAYQERQWGDKTTLEAKLRSAWIAGYESADRDAKKKARMAPDVYPVAHLLALELECLLLDTKDMAIASKWWDSAHAALEQWRTLIRLHCEETR